jgi:hypothetical protein
MLGLPGIWLCFETKRNEKTVVSLNDFALQTYILSYINVDYTG